VLIVVANLVVLGALVAVCVLRWSALAALLLAVVSAAWLPVNNGRLEGPVLITVDPKHGLTTMDLVAYFGFLIVIWSTVRARRVGAASAAGKPVALASVGASLLLVCGLAVSYVYRN